MHVLFVCSEYPIDPDQPTGGFGRYVQTISEGLVVSGHKVTILCQGKKNSLFKNDDGVYIHSVKPFGLPFFLGRRIIQFLNYPLFWSFSVWRIILGLHQKESIDIIEGGDFAAELFFFLLFSKRRIPTVIKLHTPSFVIHTFNDDQNTLFYQVLYHMEVFCLRRATSLNSPTVSLANIVSREIRRPISSIIPYPIEVPKIKKSVKRNPFLILYAGKLQPKKGVFTLLEAASIVVEKLPKAHFLFVGPDTLWKNQSTRKRMEAFIDTQRLGKNCVIKSEVRKDALNGLFQRAVITVIPSDWENFPNVCLEAIVQGSTVLATSVGGIKEMIEHNISGFLVPPEDPVMLARGIVILLSNPQKRKILSHQANRNIQKKYNLQKISQQTIDFYKGCLYLSINL